MTTQAIPHDTVLSSSAAGRSRGALWAGRVLFIIPVLFLLMDGTMKLFQPAPVVEAMEQLGFAAGLAPVLGVILLACLALYLVPRTAVLGAVLLTAYLGGAIATHVRVGNPLFSHVLFPVYLAVMIWGALCLRDARVRALLLAEPAR
ncbi:DoxX family protein [Longimicrobium terrae]|uniref:DoxX family protein n=1 Tax=Longimicrobium terrae TaxID=1639882 RepID=A0A841GW45_9BACT|nr:DoxX family protein [Longimicrobium terrae]MBB4635520.1 hypothetical protein [Longimicrobium terrae]MBB6069914.1 hypothetical protein [Longimicrobium terrae]NNC32827.1 DoxX family protein [Longimicrobium terrae]